MANNAKTAEDRLARLGIHLWLHQFLPVPVRPPLSIT
jgi:hypothetical protein